LAKIDQRLIDATQSHKSAAKMSIYFSGYGLEDFKAAIDQIAIPMPSLVLCGSADAS
jgi:hypothetical protein